ncbi:centrosomal protein of 63 kDa isoform X2 [Opisthocomus hoazin]|uniref:centrosomal protein of 63 kDa isoform X2 n=1 Tax=Opisthocomus hoazin TaxID=30419 RepID=UPI003F53D383
MMESLLEGMQRNQQGSGGFLTSCEAELQELMKQIDIMVAHKKAEWEEQTQGLEACLSVREQELSSARAALQEKQKEVDMLHHQVEDMEKAKQDMATEYEQQLKKFREELSRLRRGYEKLQSKQRREIRGEASKRQGEDESEMSRLTRKLEEFHQKSLDWEKQRLLYQQQVVSLEAQRKALTELMQTQLTNRTKILESVEVASQSEIRQLTSKLERANDAIRAKELEVERLNRRADDLTENNRMILEDQQRVQEELTQSKKMLKVLQDEKVELRATLQSQEHFIESSKLHEEQLQKELAGLTETLHTKEHVIRALEERLQEQQLPSPELEHILLQLDVGQKKEQHLLSEVDRLKNSLVSSNARCLQLSEELDENIKELQSKEEHLTESKAKIKKAFLVQLESLRLENHRLSEMLEQTEFGILQGKGVTIRALSEDYALEIKELKSENQQLQKDLAEARAKLELTQQVCQDGPEGTAQQMQREEPEARDVQYRTIWEAQHRHDEEAASIHCMPDGTVQHYQREFQSWGAAETGTVTPEMGELPAQTSRKNSMEPLALDALLGMDSLLHELDGNKDFEDTASKQSTSNNQRESVPLCPVPTASVGSIAARYVEEEDRRSQRILECLNAHLEEMEEESEKIVRRFGHQE